MKSRQPQRRQPVLALLLFLVWLPGLILAPVRAHEGEDHSHEAPVQIAPQAQAPRGETHSDDIAVLVVQHAPELIIYLNHAASNEPLQAQQVELESGGHKLLPRAIAPGVYQGAAPWLNQAGEHALLITVQTPTLNDLLTVTLDNRSTTPPVTGPDWTRWALAAGAATVLLIGIVLLAYRMRRRLLRSQAHV